MRKKIYTKCDYCANEAIGYDALGLAACVNHLGEADGYLERNASNKAGVTNGKNRWPISKGVLYVEDDYEIDFLSDPPAKKDEEDADTW